MTQQLDIHAKFADVAHGISPHWTNSPPPPRRAVVSSIQLPSSRIPTSIGGPGRFSRTDHPETESSSRRRSSGVCRAPPAAFA
jgi:hypothetical protein